MSLACTFAALALAVPRARAQGVDVLATVVVESSPSAGAAKHKDAVSSADVVVWLTSVAPDAPRIPDTQHPGPFRLVQKDKQFTPHLLVVPTGSSVEFPNKDPFFHNVFSLFNGKRFDLGLYESGSSRSVRFDREGVSYIFCNIHPEMGSVVLAISTPYYATSNAAGAVLIHAVPPGSYRLHVWSETAQLADPAVAQQIVQVSTTAVRLNQFVLRTTVDPMLHHKNKFGDDYLPGRTPPY